MPIKAGLEIREEAHHVLALELLAQPHLPMLIDSMHLQHRLCQIDPNRRNLHGDAPSQKWLVDNSTLAPRCRLRKGASIPLDLIQQLLCHGVLAPRSAAIEPETFGSDAKISRNQSPANGHAALLGG